MAQDFINVDTQPELVYNQYSNGPDANLNIAIPLPVEAVTSINSVSGPTITLSGGTTGLSFATAASTISLTGTLIPANGGTGQASYTKGDLLAASGAAALAKLGVGSNNARLAADSTQVTGLIWINASTGWSTWTGTNDRASHATYSGTASAGYVQLEMQGVMDSLKQVTEAFKALVADMVSQKILNP